MGDLRDVLTILPTTFKCIRGNNKKCYCSGINDPRFDKVEEEELLDLDFSVDVLTEPELVRKKVFDTKEIWSDCRLKGKGNFYSNPEGLTC